MPFSSTYCRLIHIYTLIICPTKRCGEGRRYGTTWQCLRPPNNFSRDSVPGTVNCDNWLFLFSLFNFSSLAHALCSTSNSIVRKYRHVVLRITLQLHVLVGSMHLVTDLTRLICSYKMIRNITLQYSHTIV